MRFFKLLALSIFLLNNYQNLHAQLNPSDGLRAPGDWDVPPGWANPPVTPELNLSLISSTNLLDGTKTFWHTPGVFNVRSSGIYNFKLVNTSYGNVWGNQWGNATFSGEDTKAPFDFGSVGNASITLNVGNYFIVFHDQGYAPTTASIINVGDSYTAITSTTESPGRPSVSGSDITFEISTNASPGDNGPTNLKVWVVLAQSGNYVSHQELISSGTDHDCVVSSVANGTYDYFYVVTSPSAWTNFVASGDNTLSNLQHFVTYCYNPQSQITVSPCQSLTSGGSVSSPFTISGCASLDPDQMNSSVAASGGSGGTLNYLWEKSTDGGSTWVTANGTNAYLNPSTITQTTLFRRGASRCATASVGGSEQYTSSVTFTINANPSSVSVSGGGNTCGTRTLTASGGSGGTIYWQNTSSGGTSTSTATSSQDISATGTYYFRSRSSAGCWGTEGSASVTKNTSATISSQPGSLGSYSSNGSGTSNSVSATISNGSSPTYQWKYSSSSGGSYSAVSNGTPSGATYTNGTSASNFQVDGIDAAGTYYYKLYVTDTDDECSDPTSNETSLSVTSSCTEVTSAGSISGAQSNCGSFNPSSISSSGSPNGSGGTLTYHWQSSTSGSGSGFSDIAGANSSTYDPGTITQTTWYRRGAYRCNSSGIVYTSAVEKTVNAVPSSVSVSGGGSSCATATLTASGGSGGTIYWQNTTSSGTSTSTASSSEDVSSSGTYYFRSRSSAGCWGTEGSASVTIDATSVAGTASGATTICSGSTTGLTLSGNTGTIQWQESTNNSSWASETGGSGGTTTSYTTEALTSNRYYRAAVTNGSCAVTYTSSVLVGVDAASAGGSISGGSTVCNGGGGTLTLSGHTGSVTKWQSDDNSGFSSPSDIVNTSTSYSPSSLTSTTYYRAVVTNGTCSSANSSSATMTVYNAFSAGAINTTGESYCSTGSPSSTITSSSAASGGDGSISYTWHESGGSAIAGETSATYAPTAAGTYTRKAADGTCNTGGTTSSGSWVVTEVTAPNAGTISGITSSQGSNFLVVGGSATLSTTGDGSGTWSSNNGYVTVTNSSTGAISGSSAGTSTITYTKQASPCTDATATYAITAYNDVYVNPIGLVNNYNTRYVGDKGFHYQFEINQSSWNATDVGVGTDVSSYGSSMDWAAASWYADGSPPNKQVERNNSDYHFTSTGTYYVVGRGKKDAGSPYAYTDETGWANDIELTSANTTTITVSALPNPGSFAAANTDYQSTDLSWTNQTHSSGSGSYSVIVLRKTSAFSGADRPVNGTTGSTYNSAGNIGGATVVYYGSGTTLDESSLSAGTSYYYEIYSENYGYYSSGSAITVTTDAAPSISTTASLSTFVGCAGSAGTEQTFTISGSNLVANITVTAPSGYEVSKSSGASYSGDGGSVTFSPSSGTVASSTVYVRLSSSASNGASGNIACTSTGATTVNEATGSGTVESAPNTQASSFSSSSVGPETATVSWTRGNGDKVLVVARASSAVATDPSNGSSYSANAAFGSGGAIGSGYVVYDGIGTSVNLTGLSVSTTYHFAIYEYETGNSCNLYNASQLTGNFTTATPAISTSASFSTFVSCAGSAGTAQSFTISGSNLTTDITVTAPTGYEVSTDNSSFSSNVVLSESGGSVGSTTIYVRLTSSASNGASGNVACTSTGASTQNEATSSGTVHSTPGTQASSFTSSSVGNTTATVGWTRGNGDEVVVVAKASSAPSTDPTNGVSYTANAAFGSGDALSGGFVVYKGIGTSVNLTNLSNSVTYHIAVYEVETGNSCNLYNATQLTGNFTTSAPTIATSGSISSFTSCNGVAGAEQNFTISGSNLTADITVTAPTGYEVSKTSGGSFSGSITFTPSSGTVASSSVYVRLTSSASDGASGNVACTSTGATTQNVATGSGSVTTAPNAGTLSGTQAVCSTGSTTFSTDGNAGGTWTSGTTGVATIDASSGAITPVSAGSSTITYTVSASPCADATATRVVTITAAPTSGTISGTNSVAIGQTSQLSVSGNSASGSWGTSNSSLATVSGSGLVTGVAAGSPNITYTVTGTGGCSDATDTYAVTVTGTIATVGTGNWNDASSWGSGSVPTAGQDVTILHDITVNTNTSDLGNLTVNSGVTLSIGAYTVSVDGAYDASGGNTTFTDAGTLKLSGAVTSLGTFVKATNCTVTYDGGNQTVAALSGSPVSNSYYNLVINGTGTKTLAGSTRIDGDLTLTASTFDLSNKTIYPKANITASSGSITASGSATITFNNSASHNIAGINSSNVTIKTTSSSGTVTTAGNITCKSIDLTSGTQTFVVDGEDVVVEDDIVVTAGTLQLTSGTIAVNSNSANSAVIEGGTLDIDGGTLTVGDNSLADLKMTSGSIDISSGTLTVKDQINIIDGTFTQSGGTVNVCDHNATSGGSSADKFSILAGNLNLTGGDLYLRGQSSSSYDCMYIPSTGVTVTNTSSHTTHIQPNNTDDEDMYLNVNGNELGNLTINLNQSNHEVYLQSGLALEGNLTISAGDLQTVSGNTLTMSGGTQTISIAGGSVTGTDAGGGNDLTLAISSGSTTTFTGNATSNSDHEKKFFNVNVNSGATLELSRGIMCRYGTFTVDGDLQINDNGYVQSVGVSPTYGNSSTLIYNSTGAFGRNHEWTSTSGAGYPNDVSVIQGSVNLGSGATSTARQIAGDLSISSGAGFYMDYGSDDMTAALTINGNVTNSGTLSLSGSAGGDLVLKGDFSQNGTFNHNSRSVTLSGSSDQAISTTGSSVGFGFLTINNASNDIDPADDITVANDFTITAGELDLSSHTAMVTGTSDVNGTLTVSSGTFDANGTFDATGGNVTFSGAGRLELGGTVTSLGTFTGGGSSTVSYNGASTQTIDDFSAKSGPYDNLDLDGGGQKDLSGNTTVNLVLSWSADCDMTTNGHTLTIKQSPTGYNDSRVITGGSSTTVSVAYSSSSTSECFIPVGINGDVRDISISAASATAETYTVVYTPGSPYGGAGTLFNGVSTGAPINSTADAAHVNNHYYYDISRSGSVNATLKLKFSGLTEPSDADKYVMHWNSGTSEWDQLSSTGASGYVTALATSFSPFGQGSGGSALPIDLVSFTGVCENNETELEFVVASQINNDYFSIHRSENATDWNMIGEIEGVGNTNTQMTFKWIDNNPFNGINYYRLSQTDYDGTSEIFSPIAVMCENAPVDGYSVYPNPANGLLNIDLELENYQGDDVSIEVIDINGKIILLQQVQLNRGYNHLEVDLSETPSGVYMINFVGTRDYIKESRIIKQ